MPDWSLSIDNSQLSIWGLLAPAAKLKAFLACQAKTLMLTYFLVSERRCAGIHHGRYLPSARTTESIKLKLKSHRWHKTAIAAAATALFGFWATNACALSLGSITVQSALGEPLRAEIEVPDINAEEAASLKTAVASPEAFRAAGLDYNPAMSGLRATLQRRPDGRAYIRLSSDKPVNEPFVDMILEASWSSGRIVRDFTMLFDPPNLRAPAVPVATLPQTAAPVPQVSTTAPTVRNPVLPAPAVPAVAVPRKTTVAPKASSTPKAAVNRPSTQPTPPDGRQIKVKSGDTASRIAASIKPASISLDQMLVALLRTNPDAFIDGNINRIKSGALLTVPTAEQAGVISSSEAGQTVTAQSKDFNEFRKKLAGSAASAQIAAADRRSGGKVQARVEDSKPGASAPDKLKLSKGAIQAQAAVDNIAKERAAKEASSKAAELSKNISELAKIGAASSPVLPGVQTGSAVVQPASTPKVAASSPEPVQSPISTPAPVPAIASAPASAPAAAKRPASTVPPKPAAEPGFVDQLLENPVAPAGAVGLIALLAGFAFYRSRKQKKALQEDSAFLESRLQPDSFFGASGGQRIDTNDGVQTGSSMVYSPSQLDAADDVDPVAEADVYLAYGRDMQAEEILKEASKANPGRIAIQHKLLEIYAKRRDAKNFERVANEVHKLSSGEGPDWQRVCELGLGIDPSNALYQPGGEPSRNVIPSRPMGLERSGGFTANTVPQPLSAGVAKSVDLDLDLDFSLEEENASIVSELRSTDPMFTMDRVNTAPSPLDANRIADTKALLASGMTGSAGKQDTVKFELPGLGAAAPKLPAERESFRNQAAASYGSTAPLPLTPVEPVKTAQAALDSGLLEFDLGSLSLDLGDSSAGTSAAIAVAQEPDDPLTTKLSLAEEFSAIGDEDGARALIEEVISEASGDMKLRAQQALSKLS
jgi:pilus assembly protein FimV